MNIALMTWFEHHNYGTALQAVALNHVLSDDNNVEVVNYHTRPIHTDSNKGILRELLNRLSIFCNPKFNSNKREVAFKEFLLKHLSFTDRCDILSELELLNKKYDCFICGSDQIWNPARFDSHYFLDYVLQPNRMIAYAPSLGVSSLENDIVKQKIIYLVSRFNHLSVRESVSAELLANLTGKNVEVTLDPTLLLNKKEWDLIINHSFEEDDDKYALVYMLGNNRKHWRNIRSFVKSTGIKLKIIPVYDKDTRRSGCINSTVGPEEFVSLIKHAEYVLTDSFHAVALSIIYERPFGVFERFKIKEEFNQNSRIYNLLEITNLNSRIITNDIPMDGINYSDVNALLDKKRKISYIFLSNALKSVKTCVTEITMANNVKDLIDICCGCGACEQVCPNSSIKMIRNKKGFFESVIDKSSCISCGACQHVCPLIFNDKAIHLREGALYSYKDSNLELLKKSSSGGAGYAIGRIGLKSGCTVIGCSFDKDTQESVFNSINTEEELKNTQGSKYMQSFFGDALMFLKEGNKPYYVFGLPCQIAAARKLYGENAIYIDLICHGVPTYNLYRMYQKHLNEYYGIDTYKMEVCFRDKSNGWRERFIKVSDTKQQIITSQYDDPYYILYESGLCYATSCYECPWRDRSMADIRIGDYWGPKFTNDKEGVSMVLALTDRGNKIVCSLSDSGQLNNTDISDIYTWQQTSNKSEPLITSHLIDDLSNDYISYKKIYEQYIGPYKRQMAKQQKINQVVRLGKTIIGML